MVLVLGQEQNTSSSKTSFYNICMPIQWVINQNKHPLAALS